MTPNQLIDLLRQDLCPGEPTNTYLASCWKAGARFYNYPITQIWTLDDEVITHICVVRDARSNPILLVVGYDDTNSVFLFTENIDENRIRIYTDNLAEKQLSTNQISAPDWSDAPEWATFLAQDQSGDWYWFWKEPTISDTGMWESDTIYCKAYRVSNWEDTLQPKPIEEGKK
jgi:hypothetical protein